MSDQNYQDPYAQQSANPSQPYTQQSANPGQPYAQQSANPSQPYAQQGQYGQMAPAAGNYPAATTTQDHPQAQTVLILGIVGIFIGICSWIAWYMGGKAKKEIAAGAPYRFEGNLKTGYLLGKVFGILYIIGLAVYIIAFILLMIMAGTSHSS